MNHAYAVVLAGGQSSRLFPFNKVLSDLTGSGRTLLQQTYDRTCPLIPAERFYVLTTRSSARPIQAQLGLSKNHFWVDPVRRGTWPALMWAMAHVQKENPAAVLAVLTADHVIPNASAFRKAVASAVAVAQTEPAVVMLGIRPNRDPESWKGFGALKSGILERRLSSPGIKPVIDFEEKPSLTRAKAMIKENGLARRSLGGGGWSWNAGMFFFRISTAEAALRHYQPAMWETYEALAEAVAKEHPSRAVELFKSFPLRIPHPLKSTQRVDNTMDYAILTPMVHQPFDGAKPYILPNALPGWMDVGEWTALRRLIKADRRGNVKIGRVRNDPATRKSILAADAGYQLEAVGVEGCIVAISDAGALVIPEKEVSQLKERVKARRGWLVSWGVPHLKVVRRRRRLIVTRPSVL